MTKGGGQQIHNQATLTKPIHANLEKFGTLVVVCASWCAIGKNLSSIKNTKDERSHGLVDLPSVKLLGVMHRREPLADAKACGSN